MPGITFLETYIKINLEMLTNLCDVQVDEDVQVVLFL